MSPILQYILRRLLAIPLTILVITMVMFAIIMATPPIERAKLFLPKEIPARLSFDEIDAFILETIEDRGLDDPFLYNMVDGLEISLREIWVGVQYFNLMC